MTRLVRSFHKSIGKVQTADSEFKCKGQLKTMMRGDAKKNLFTLEKYVKLPAEARALCESNNNLMVKALANVNPDVPITPENTAEAIRNLKHVDVIMIEEEMEMKSMYMLYACLPFFSSVARHTYTSSLRNRMDSIGLPMGAYISCTPYEDQATNEWSNRVVDTLSRDNQGDRDLYSEVHYIFNTKYAGTAEQKVNAGATVCTKPHVCFDECDKNGEKKAKNPFKDVKTTLSYAHLPLFNPSTPAYLHTNLHTHPQQAIYIEAKRALCVLVPTTPADLRHGPASLSTLHTGRYLCHIFWHPSVPFVLLSQPVLAGYTGVRRSVSILHILTVFSFSALLPCVLS